ncbi:MAG: EscU/YscU/HrcU family type III secretion system export apparatus switch protein [Blastocatellia bacterium]
MSQNGEKTEKPTKKKLKDARKKGQVAKSTDLTQALMLIAAVIALVVSGGLTGSILIEAVRHWVQQAGAFKGSLDLHSAISMLSTATMTMLLALAPLLLSVTVIALLVGYAQVGGMFVGEPLKPSLSKINPVEGFKNKFLKMRPYVELARTIVKMTVCATVIALVLWGHRNDIIATIQQPLINAAQFTASLIIELGWKVAIAFVILGIGDFFLQQFLYRKEMMMTKHEVKEEYKETEGNPLHKFERRKLHREVLSHDLAAAVKKSQVIVVNPTHLAVALQYDETTMNAPTVMASGADLMAAKIRALAQESGVPIVRDVPLARALYAVEVEDEIPEDLYEAVAVLLRWVYQVADEQKGVTRHV